MSERPTPRLMPFTVFLEHHVNRLNDELGWSLTEKEIGNWVDDGRQKEIGFIELEDEIPKVAQAYRKHILGTTFRQGLPKTIRALSSKNE